MRLPVPTYQLPNLPPPVQLETVPVYQALTRARANLGELKGVAQTIPNQDILIDTITLQEAKVSSEIENIVTTQDDIYKSAIELPVAGVTREVALYRDVLRLGWEGMQARAGIITNNLLIDQYRLLKRRSDGFRDSAGAVLQDGDGRTVHVPPQAPADIQRYMGELERFINEDEMGNLDPLIRMAIIHHQFESIHPFSDGNGRIGRMLNLLYLCRTGLLDRPILYLSGAINRRKGDYYRLLQAPREAGDAALLQSAWENWVIFLLEVVAETARTTIELVTGIRSQMAEMKRILCDGALKNKNIYSHELLNNLFRHPYTSVRYVQQELGVSRPTATRYLHLLVREQLLTKCRHGRANYYVNHALVELFERSQ